MSKRAAYSRPTYAEVSAELFLSNLNYLRSKLNNEFFCPMIKANAYGHGDQLIARLAQMYGVEHLGVGTLEEGIQVRESGFAGEVLIFAANYRNAMPLINKYNLRPVVSSFDHVEELNDIAVHIELNTAMHRMGFSLNEVEQIKHAMQQAKLEVIGIMTHFSNGMNIIKENSSAQRQMHVFKEFVSKHFSEVQFKHIHNSDANLASAGPLEFGARPGIALYGYSAKRNENIKPIMRLKTHIVKINTVKEGEGVSYGPIWRAKRDSKIAVLPIGYADGLRRSLSGQYQFKCNGQMISQVGLVCMDYCMVDITKLQGIDIGQEIVIFGEDKEMVYQQAKLAKTIPYEVLTAISDRVPRILVEKFI